ncbi:MAG: hypothetical protein MZU84_06870 [Sphingobacterium sp.]|nr:hypothetical protein [Sphingobacterium sp.]
MRSIPRAAPLVDEIGSRLAGGGFIVRIHAEQDDFQVRIRLLEQAAGFGAGEP